MPIFQTSGSTEKLNNLLRVTQKETVQSGLVDRPTEKRWRTYPWLLVFSQQMEERAWGAQVGSFNGLA